MSTPVRPIQALGPFVRIQCSHFCQARRAHNHTSSFVSPIKGCWVQAQKNHPTQEQLKVVHVSSKALTNVLVSLIATCAS